MDILETLFSKNRNGDDTKEENEAAGVGGDDINDEAESGSDEAEAEDEPNIKIARKGEAGVGSRRNRPERGKFTILDGVAVAAPDEILQIDFTPDLIQNLFKDSRVGIQFLARYGIIPNTRECKIESCPKEQLMSLIKHANGYVWRCRSCRKRRERRVITKISVYEGTFLFYSRMPMNKFFVFMLVWAENAGYTASEYNRILGEYRLVEETIHNTIGFIRDHIQTWCLLKASSIPIGGNGKTIEILETFHTEDVSAKHRNRRERQFTMKFVLICWQTDELAVAEFPDKQFTKPLLLHTVHKYVEEGSTIVMRDQLLDRFGEQEQIQNLLGGGYQVKTIADVWLTLDEKERDKQYMKTLIEGIPMPLTEPFAYEYYFRRRFMEKPFNHLLKAIREIYQQNINGGQII